MSDFGSKEGVAMARIYWMVLIFGVAVSLIWWPGMKNEAYIFSVIEKERAWQMENLGFDLVSTIDEGMRKIQRAWSFGVIPMGDESSIEMTQGFAESEMMAATERTGNTPYFKALFALLVLAIGRLCTTGVLGLLMLPLFGACIIDGLVQRGVRLSRFKSPESFHFRVAWAGVFAVAEGMILLSLVPDCLGGELLVFGFLILGYVVQRCALNYYSTSA